MHIRPSDAERKNLVFVDNVRFWSMFSVIAVHCLISAAAGESPRDRAMMTMLLSVPVKLGTIGFFLISGFLLGHKVQTSPRTEYLGRRLKRVFVPWLMWCSLMVLDLCWHRRMEFALGTDRLQLFGRQWYTVLVNSPFWFVPNLMIGISLLLLFRRYLYDSRLGAVLLAINLFYTVNIFGQWAPSAHSEALLGFVFYLWLGSYAAHRFTSLIAWLNRVPMRVMLAATLAAACCSYGESRLIYHLQSPDPENTLRLSNQICSVLGVLTLMKVKRPAWPGFLDARRETFGLYLSHTLSLELAVLFMQATVGRFLPGLLTDRVGLLLVWPALFFLVYGAALGITKALAGWSATSWLVGVERGPRARVIELREDVPV
jgi:fucose 4-O-acetylase-like acetyltransferase